MSYPTPPQQPYGPPPPPPLPPVPRQKNRTLQITGVVGAVLAAFGVGAVVGAAAAGGDDGGGNEARPAATVTVTADPGGKSGDGDGGEAQEADDAAEAGQAGDDSFGLTETAAYESGFEVVLSDFERATSSEYAAPASTPYVRFTLKLTNGSEKRLDLNTLMIGCQYGDQGRSGEQIFDEGLDTPTTHLRPGRSIDVLAGCELPAAEGYVQIEVTPDWESTTAIFAGKVD